VQKLRKEQLKNKSIALIVPTKKKEERPSLFLVHLNAIKSKHEEQVI
jgi:hypothetical protein